MNTDLTYQQLAQRKLQGLAARYPAIAQQPVHQQLEADAMVSMIVEV